MNLADMLFCDIWDGLSLIEQIDVHNIYCRNNGAGCEIYENCESVIDEIFSKPSDVLLACINGCYKISDNYIWINSYGNLESGSYEDDLPLTNKTTMGKWFSENSNWDKLKMINDFSKFGDLCSEQEKW